jgi:hypothetical protein
LGYLLQFMRDTAQLEELEPKFREDGDTHEKVSRTVDFRVVSHVHVAEDLQPFQEVALEGT